MSGACAGRPDRRFDVLPPWRGLPPLVRIYQAAPPSLQFLTAYVEACDGIGLVRTLDESRGIVECWVMADFVADFDRQIAAVGRQWPIQPLDRAFE